ncbi:MAG TPA: hypothetical protein VK464_27210 [Symbiobacteriaceae bacterium]|nr:hypothetical protein [Symbiobacteriaceae bacterium]
MRKLGVWLVVLALVLTGCGASGSGRREFKSLVYTVSGGIAGLDQRLNITAGGTFQLAEKDRPAKTGTLTPAEFKAVQSLVAAVNWPALQQQYVNPRVADAIFEGVTVSLGAKSYTAVAGTGGQPPAELGALLSRLNQVLTDHR